MMGIHTKFPDLCDAKNREKYMPKRNNHTQDSIYVVRQFAYIHEVAEISLFLGEKYRMQQYSFFSFKKKKTFETLISKPTVFVSCAQDSQWATKIAKKFYDLGLLAQASAPWIKPQKISH